MFHFSMLTWNLAIIQPQKFSRFQKHLPEIAAVADAVDLSQPTILNSDSSSSGSSSSSSSSEDEGSADSSPSSDSEADRKQRKKRFISSLLFFLLCRNVHCSGKISYNIPVIEQFFHVMFLVTCLFWKCFSLSFQASCIRSVPEWKLLQENTISQPSVAP